MKAEVKTKFLIDYCHQHDWDVQGGKLQSPIDIQTNQTQMESTRIGIQLNLSSTPATFFNNGQNLQLLGSGQACLNHRVFDFVQVHFHADGEHRIDGEHFPLEGHFLFQAPNGQTGVIGVLYRAGKHNSDFDHVLKQYEEEKGEGSFSVETLIPENKSYYHYIGSLTTPPLTEGIEWYVLQTVLEVSSEQIERFISLHGKNSRSCQALHDRQVIEFGE
ncbi:carbonic anhydrase family protein [Enterococcus hailinensis]|uniref:carbonic anhydrase family protein n=1 Tax=Enterococcus hailinensis TaxID=3238988 RepID=UPI0038B3488A